MGFKIEEATIEDIQLAFRNNQLTSKQLVQYYLNAIEKLNPILKAVIETNPDAIAQAEQADCFRNLPSLGCVCGCNGINNETPGMLRGIPVLLKDNIATKDKLNTTAGSFALYGSVVPRDAGVVDRLRRAGAIILGKAGLTQWAGFRSLPMPPGWSSRGGGTVKNPYVLTADPGGSSTGSAVSVSANLVTVSLGTETSGSIIDPCGRCGVVGIKPTVGLTCRSGVIPISLRQDSVGPIGRTVSDAVHLLDAIVGYHSRDEITKDLCKSIPSGGYKQFLKTEGLRRKRLGNLWHYFEGQYESTSLKVCKFQEHFEAIRKNGAVLLDNLDMPNFEIINNPLASGALEALKYEFKRDLNAYLSNLLESPIRSLAKAIAYNKLHSKQEKLEEYGQMLFIESEETTLPSSKYDELTTALAKLLEEGFEKFMRDNNLDAIVAPEALGVTMLASGGYPTITVPAGLDSDGVPFGIMFGGLKGSEATLIEITYAFEQITKARKPPTLAT